jgi:hypothetical protein
MAELVSFSHWGLIGVPDAFEKDMAARKQRYDGGDRGAVLEALYFCLSCREQVPDWVTHAFCRAYAEVIGARAGSWDSVFGKPWKKGTHLKKARERKDLEFKVWISVCALHRVGMPIDELIFQTVGEDLECGARQVKEMYYEIERAFQPEP